MTQFFESLNLEWEQWVLLIVGFTFLVEIISGLMKAGKNHTFSSRVGNRSLFKNVGFMVIAIMAFYFFTSLPDKPIDIINLSVGDSIGVAIIIFYEINMLGSISENLDEAGYPLPKFVKKPLATANNTISNGSASDVVKMALELYKNVSNPTELIKKEIEEAESDEADDKNEDKSAAQENKQPEPELTKETPPTSTNSDVEFQQNKTSSNSTMPKRLN